MKKLIFTTAMICASTVIFAQAKKEKMEVNICGQKADTIEYSVFENCPQVISTSKDWKIKSYKVTIPGSSIKDYAVKDNKFNEAILKELKKKHGVKVFFMDFEAEDADGKPFKLHPVTFIIK